MAAVTCSPLSVGAGSQLRVAPTRICSGPQIFSRDVGLKLNCRRSRAIHAVMPELVPPPIDNDFLDLLRESGADISEDGVVETFGRDVEACKAADNGSVVVEMSHFGRLRVTGDDRLRFLHNQSTADILPLNEGEGCDTVFVTNTARTIDLATAWAMKTSVILFISPNTRHELVQMLNKYIFFSDKVEVEDITEKTCYFSLIGPESDNIMRQLNLEHLIGKPYGSHIHYSANGAPVTVGVGSGLAIKGYSFLLSAGAAGPVWESITEAGAVPMGAHGWERLRILQGRPAAGKELTTEFNVLEAGLLHTTSLSKGCYIGQETVARLITYDGIKQHLFGVELSAPVQPGTQILTTDGIKAGKLTSCTSEPPFIGLGYIRKQAGGEGLKVELGEGVKGSIFNVAYVKQHPQQQQQQQQHQQQ